MACMNDYVRVPLRCTYQPCGHEGSITVHKYEVINIQTRHCPKCNLFTFSPIPWLEMYGLDENPDFVAAVGKLKAEEG